ncbi:hemolysin XhlA [Gottschalkia purinilytica]|uniref:Hemolysin XhlA n=1 Tax=Gottschalkia purinilytica TaxID=1503 RepID=A0A0L0WD02_GOTPU|nr:hemolysin XhlA family protein [Gottschalkia purinilytica]KNF09295.1 hemolysin XhlA [Gottschalkia purinilytica]
MSENIIQEMRERLVKIETMIEMSMTDTNKRIDKLEDNQKWLWRAIATSIISGAIAFLFKG